jgi:hypothetical protein
MGWDNWQDVQHSFDMKEPEPSQVLLAFYDSDGSYDCSTYVIYRKGRSYYTVSGGHCSCYGLEDQWKPEEYTKLQLIEALRKAQRDEHEDAVLKELEATE